MPAMHQTVPAALEFDFDRLFVRQLLLYVPSACKSNAVQTVGALSPCLLSSSSLTDDRVGSRFRQ